MDKNVGTQAIESFLSDVKDGDEHNQENSNYYYSEEQIWGTNQEGDLLSTAVASSRHLFLDVLLPNGLLIPIQCPFSRTLAQVRHF